jgi:magnesium chelatase family protein
MLVKTFAGAVHGVEATMITVEISAGGIPAENDAKNTPFYFLVGLPDNAVKEGWQRIEAALKNSKFSLPRVKLVVNLAICGRRVRPTIYRLLWGFMPLLINCISKT